MKSLSIAIVASLLTLPVTPVQAQTPATATPATTPAQYGAPINLEAARKAIAAAQAEARKNTWPVAIAIVDTHGLLVAFEKFDNTQTGSVQVAIDKAISAATYRRSTKVFQDAVSGGGVGMRVLNLRSASAVEGGLPIIIEGRVAGAIGVSGVNADQDGMVAKAGADAVK